MARNIYMYNIIIGKFMALNRLRARFALNYIHHWISPGNTLDWGGQHHNLELISI